MNLLTGASLLALAESIYYADVVGSPREDSHIKMKGMLVGKLTFKP